MNPLNYATLEASRRLAEAGIVLETEAAWYLIPALREEETEKWILSADRDGVMKCLHRIPAPSMAEVWRELPEKVHINRKAMMEVEGLAVCGYWHLHNGFQSGEAFTDNNPTDALIDLLIWVRKEVV